MHHVIATMTAIATRDLRKDQLVGASDIRDVRPMTEDEVEASRTKLAADAFDSLPRQLESVLLSMREGWIGREYAAMRLHAIAEDLYDKANELQWEAL